MIRNIELSKISANPFQTRHSEDPEHIQSLAKSIQEHGLLQIPSARMMSGSEDQVQLAFGHSRFAAYKILAESTDIDNPQDFEKMPLNIVELDDLQMFEQAVAENRERKDLNPIEEARAMVVYKDHFKKTSEQIGELFHLSDSAVRNKIRLLDLPEDVKEAYQAGNLSESIGRELLTYYSLPEKIREENAGGYGQDFINGKELVQKALEGVPAATIHHWIEMLIKKGGMRMDQKPWKHTEELQGEKIVGICKGCAFLLKHDDIEFCLKPECYHDKNRAWRQSYLEQASLLSGYPVLPIKDNERYTGFKYGKEVKLKEIRAARCENLRVMFDPYANPKDKDEKPSHLMEEGYPQAQIVCCKGTGFCTCLKAMDAGVKLDPAEDGASLAGEELKGLNRQIRAQKKFDQRAIENMTTDLSLKILEGLESGARGVWEEIHDRMGGYSEEAREDSKKIKDGAGVNDIKFFVAKRLAERNNGWMESPRDRIKEINKNLVKMGLEELPYLLEAPLPSASPQMSSDEENHSEHLGGEITAGKTLVEVFAAEEGE